MFKSFLVLLCVTSVYSSSIWLQKRQLPAGGSSPFSSDLLSKFSSGLGGLGSQGQTGGSSKALEVLKQLFGGSGAGNLNNGNQNQNGGDVPGTGAGAGTGNQASGIQAVELMKTLFNGLGGLRGQGAGNPLQQQETGSGLGNNKNPIDMFKGLMG